jgi:hypothetical protein
MRTTSPKEIESVLKLDGAARFKHFVKRVVDEERAWGLWNEGWGLMADSDGGRVFPLWPAREYAQLCAVGEWAGYVPTEIPLCDLLEELATKLLARATAPGIFPTPEGKSVAVPVNELIDALRAEMEKYG